MIESVHLSDIVFLIGPLLLGMLSGARKYVQCNTKPSLQPPGFVFAIAWSILYTLFGVSCFITWRKNGRRFDTNLIALLILLASLILWGIIFLRICATELAFISIVALLGMTIGVAILLAHNNNLIASILIWPLIGWLAFASYLSYATLN